MKAERDCFDPARRSTLAKRSFDSVIEVFSFILLLCYLYLCFSLPLATGLVRANRPKAGRQPQSNPDRLRGSVAK